LHPDDKQRLQDMLQYAMEALEHAKGKERADLHHQRLLELSLTRLVEIVGEAASKVSPRCQAQCTDIPWSDIIGMRNRIAHGYDVVDVDVL
jgi:uncharacterized protein with HEPN domain